MEQKPRCRFLEGGQFGPGASFFFSRGQGDLGHAGKFFTTIAAQLAMFGGSQDLRHYISKAIKENSQIVQAGLSAQWAQLISQPLAKLDTKLSPQALSLHTLFVTIDALDECESEDDVRLLLKLL